MKKDLFLIYLTEEKKAAENTSSAYIRDVMQFEDFLTQRGVEDSAEADNADVVAFLMDLKVKGSSKSTVNRKLASVRTYYAFLQKKMNLENNPADNIKSPKIEKKAMEYLSPEDVERLMELPDDTDKGIRDKAILELLYATGLRITELCNLKIIDVDIQEGLSMKKQLPDKGRKDRR